MSFREELNRQYAALGVSEQVIALGEEAERKCCGRFADIDRISELNQMKVLQAFRENRVSEAHLMPSTGYGYNDIGRDTLEQVYASVFHTEDALVRVLMLQQAFLYLFSHGEHRIQRSHRVLKDH